MNPWDLIQLRIYYNPTLRQALILPEIRLRPRKMSKYFFNPLIVLAVPLVFALSACTTSSGSSQSPRSTYPAQATYSCGSSGAIAVRNQRSSVIVTASGDEPVTLPASPPGQLNRYSEGIYTLVLDGPTAFWHKTGDLPRDCRR